MRKLIYALSILMVAGLSLWIYRPPTPVDHGSTVDRFVRYSFSVRNTSNAYIGQAKVGVFLPTMESGWQLTRNISATLPYTETVDPLGNRTAIFTISVPPYGQQLLSIEATVTLATWPHSIPLTPQPDSLAPAEFIESSDPAIVALAKTLKAGTSYETAKAIHHWVKSNLTPSAYDPNERGAILTFQSRHGDCTEYADLSAALLRAADIPAYVVAGYPVERDMTLRPASYHNWVEFFDGKLWRILDPHRDNFDRAYENYILFIRAPGRNRPRFAAQDARIVVEQN